MADKKTELAHCLELLSASISQWTPDLWNKALELAEELDHPAASEAYEELIHYSGEFSARNIFGFRCKPDKAQLKAYSDEFSQIAARLRDLS